MDQVERDVLLIKSVLLIERVYEAAPSKSPHQVGLYTVYRSQGYLGVVDYAATLEPEGLVLLSAARLSYETTPYRFNGGHSTEHRLPDLIDALERRLVLENLAEI